MIILDPDTAKPLFGHDQQGIWHGRLDRDQGQLIWPMYDLTDRAQHGPKLAARVINPKIIGGKSASLEHGNGQGIAKSNLQGG